MTAYYVRSGASNTAPYDTWAKAATTLGTVIAIPLVAGDLVYVGDGHSETAGAAITYNALPTTGIPYIISSQDTGDPQPPTSQNAGASIAIGAANSTLQITTGCGYFYGVTFIGGTNNNANCNIVIYSGTTSLGLIFLDTCTLQLPSAASVNIGIGITSTSTGTESDVILKNCTVKFGAVGQSIASRSVDLLIQNLSIDAAGSAPTTLFTTAVSINRSQMRVESSDLTGVSFTNLADITSRELTRWEFYGCKLPSGVNLNTGLPVSQPQTTMQKVIKCISGSTFIDYYQAGYSGEIFSETTVVKNNGAKDGTAGASRRMVSNATCTKAYPLVYEFIVTYNLSTGSAINCDIDILTDNVTLNNNEIAIETHYFSAAGSYLMTADHDSQLTDLILGTGSAQPTSTATWNTTGIGTPVTQYMRSTITPQTAGQILVRVFLYKASTTVYVDPRITGIGGGFEFTDAHGGFMDSVPGFGNPIGLIGAM